MTVYKCLHGMGPTYDLPAAGRPRLRPVVVTCNQQTVDNLSFLATD